MTDDRILDAHGLTLSFGAIPALRDVAMELYLGEILAIDSTTLTRSLRPLVKNGWIGRVPGTDRRAWSLSLSKQGKLAYETALPDWEATQRALRKKLGPGAWLDTFHSSDKLTTAAQSIGGNK